MNDRPNENHTRDELDKRYQLFTQLLVANESQVRWFLRGLLPTWDDVQEVLQKASVVAWCKFSDFEEGTSFGAWFLTISRFEALKYRRGVPTTSAVVARQRGSKAGICAVCEPRFNASRTG